MVFEGVIVRKANGASEEVLHSEGAFTADDERAALIYMVAFAAHSVVKEAGWNAIEVKLRPFMARVA